MDSDVIDLTNDVSPAEDQAAKRRIMEFARSKLQTGGQKSVETGALGLSASPLSMADAAQHAAKKLRRQDSGQEAGTSRSHAEAGPAGRPPNGPPNPGPLNPLNDTLHMLAVEREARARARQAAAQGQPSTSQPSSLNTHPTSQAQQPQQQGQQQEEASGDRICSIMTYNIWFEEHVELEARMAGLNDLIIKHKPDFILLQEVTVNMVKLFEHAPWTDLYNIERPPRAALDYFTLLCTRKATVEVAASKRVPFSSTQMGRDVMYVHARVRPEGQSTAFALPLCVGTSHLESPCGPECAPVRTGQLSEATELLAASTSGDVVFGGDMNWTPKDHSSDPELPQGWQDTWKVLRPGDTGRKFNPMTCYMGNRIDRLFGRLGTMWEGHSIEVVGTEPLPGVRTTMRGKDVPVLISDHFGLLLHLRQRRGHTLGGSSAAAAAAAITDSARLEGRAELAGGKRGRDQCEEDGQYEGLDEHEQQLLGRGRTIPATHPHTIAISDSDDDLL